MNSSSLDGVVIHLFLPGNSRSFFAFVEATFLFNKDSDVLRIPGRGTPWKINMEHKNHPIEKENHLNQTSMIMFHLNV